ncbi:hypothetical protein WDW37_16475 [Bdellovibrionota bacterium FG-1]
MHVILFLRGPLGSFGLRLALCLRRKEPLDAPFVALGVGFLGLCYFTQAFEWLDGTGQMLTHWIEKLGDSQGLKHWILESLEKASHSEGPKGSEINLTGAVEQIFRTGVWGIVSSLAEFFFLLAALFLEVGKTVLWQITVFLFPLACGLIPVLPSIVQSMIRYAVEIALWGPVLALIEITTSAAARKYMTQEGSWGLYTVAVEILAVLLILGIPRVTHQLVSGAVHPGGVSETLALIRQARNHWKPKMGVHS